MRPMPQGLMTEMYQQQLLSPGGLWGPNPNPNPNPKTRRDHRGPRLTHTLYGGDAGELLNLYGEPRLEEHQANPDRFASVAAPPLTPTPTPNINPTRTPLSECCCDTMIH